MGMELFTVFGWRLCLPNRSLELVGLVSSRGSFRNKRRNHVSWLMSIERSPSVRLPLTIEYIYITINLLETLIFKTRFKLSVFTFRGTDLKHPLEVFRSFPLYNKLSLSKLCLYSQTRQNPGITQILQLWQRDVNIFDKGGTTCGQSVDDFIGIKSSTSLPLLV